jgi:hypothetical protein
MSYPTSFNVYKKGAAAQFTLLPPRRDDNGRIQKTGAILLEVAPSQGEKSYDWKNGKITFAFGISDLSQFFDNPNSPKWGSFYHDNDGTGKKLTFSPGEGKYEGTYMMSLTSGDQRVSVALSSGEFQVLGRLFTAALPKILGWD